MHMPESGVAQHESKVAAGKLLICRENKLIDQRSRVNGDKKFQALSMLREKTIMLFALLFMREKNIKIEVMI